MNSELVSLLGSPLGKLYDLVILSSVFLSVSPRVAWSSCRLHRSGFICSYRGREFGDNLSHNQPQSQSHRYLDTHTPTGTHTPGCTHTPTGTHTPGDTHTPTGTHTHTDRYPHTWTHTHTYRYPHTWTHTHTHAHAHAHTQVSTLLETHCLGLGLATVSS